MIGPDMQVLMRVAGHLDALAEVHDSTYTPAVFFLICGATVPRREERGLNTLFSHYRYTVDRHAKPGAIILRHHVETIEAAQRLARKAIMVALTDEFTAPIKQNHGSTVERIVRSNEARYAELVNARYGGGPFYEEA